MKIKSEKHNKLNRKYASIKCPKVPREPKNLLHSRKKMSILSTNYGHCPKFTTIEISETTSYNRKLSGKKDKKPNALINVNYNNNI